MNESGFDSTPQGQDLIALLRRHAPAQPDAKAESLRVMQRINARPARMHVLGWLAPLGVAAAACAVVALMVFAPTGGMPETPETDAAKAGSPRVLTPRNAQAVGTVISVGVRTISGETITLDAGLTRGLRAGDVLESGQTRVRISVAGIFVSRAVLASGPMPSKGMRLNIDAHSPPMRRLARYEFVGGDPGALYDFGALVEALPPQTARQRGLASGRALVVVETISSLLRGEKVETSMAGKLGLQIGDVLLAANGLSTESLVDFTQALELSRRLGALKLRVIRAGQEIELTAK